MSCITNEPKHKNGILQAIREQLEHRAMWLYLLCDEAQQKGFAWEDPALRLLSGDESGQKGQNR